MAEGREEGECCGGGEEVERGIVYEFGGFWVSVVVNRVVGIFVWVFGRREVRGWYRYFEVGESAAEGGVVRDAA